MWKLEKSQNGGSLVFVLCGRIQREQLPALRQILESDGKNQNVTLDLKELKLVDQEVVEFLGQCESDGICLKNCPTYIREWIASK